MAYVMQLLHFEELVDRIFVPELKYLDDFIIITPDFETDKQILKIRKNVYFVRMN